MTLYLQYRPQTIAQLDNPKVRASLTAVLLAHDMPHGFLFAGPKGTGKTSAARIMAKALNCEAPIKTKTSVEPCNACAQCTSITRGSNLDVIEIDAASHRGIDDIRDLRESVKLSPIASRKKIYIIDEAHMLTTEAANAFLKTLEEPPNHVVFILATTNPEKLIDTVRSRLFVVNFTKATLEQIEGQLGRVAKEESIDVGPDVIAEIAHNANGSFRDAAKLFEQIVGSGKKLTLDNARQELMGSTVDQSHDFCLLLAAKDTLGALKFVEGLETSGASVETFLKGLIDQLHSMMMASVAGEKVDPILTLTDLTTLLELFTGAYSQLPGSYLEKIPVELAVLTWCGVGETGKKKGVLRDEDQTKVDEQAQPSQQETKKVDSSDVHNGVDEQSSAGFENGTWDKVLDLMRGKNMSIEALLRAVKPIRFDGTNLHLGVYYKFHKEKLETATYRNTVENTISTLIGSPVHIVCTLTDPPVREKKEEEVPALTPAADTDIINAAKEIFGS